MTNYYVEKIIEGAKLHDKNRRDCFENPFVYGLIHTPANRSEFYGKDIFDECEYFMHEAEAFRFVWNELINEDEQDFEDCLTSHVRTFDLPDRNSFRTNRRSSLKEVDAPYPANTLADLFEYSEGEQFYHSLTVDDLPANFGL